MDMDVFNRGKKEMNLSEVRKFLFDHLKEDLEKYFGFKDIKLINETTDAWFQDEYNLNARWDIITQLVHSPGKVLDLAAGCGTFLLHGLNKGFDVWGIEPEEWKRTYYINKITASFYRNEYANRLIAAYGENLPFADETFNLITTYQTLEHVTNVSQCLKECLRVLKPGGILYIRAPDYNCFFEPHYRLPFLPTMRKDWAAAYLKILRRPVLGLNSLNWTTERMIVDILYASGVEIRINDLSEFHRGRRLIRLAEMTPLFLRRQFLLKTINNIYELSTPLRNLAKFAREENNIELWVTKIEKLS